LFHIKNIKTTKLIKLAILFVRLPNSYKIVEKVTTRQTTLMFQNYYFYIFYYSAVYFRVYDNDKETK